MKTAIVGLGFMGAMHLDAYARIPDLQVAAVCMERKRDPKTALGEIGGNIKRQDSSFDFSGVRTFSHWSELVKDPDLDMVDICLPTDLHAPVALAALAAGKHVLCEKPMAATLSECERMLGAAREHKRILMVGQVLRFWPEYMFLRQQVESEKYGPVRSARFVRSCGIPAWSRWLTDESRSGGAVLDLLVHDIDQILLLFGLPSRVSAKSIGEMDTIEATLTCRGDLPVTLSGGWLPPETPLSMTFDVAWERARLEFTADGLFLTEANGERTPVKLPAADGYAAEVEYFVNCCRENVAPLQCLPEDSMSAVKVALGLKQSRAAGGEEIKCSV